MAFKSTQPARREAALRKDIAQTNKLQGWAQILLQGVQVGVGAYSTLSKLPGQVRIGNAQAETMEMINNVNRPLTGQKTGTKKAQLSADENKAILASLKAKGGQPTAKAVGAQQGQADLQTLKAKEFASMFASEFSKGGLPTAKELGRQTAGTKMTKLKLEEGTAAMNEKANRANKDAHTAYLWSLINKIDQGRWIDKQKFSMWYKKANAKRGPGVSHKYYQNMLKLVDNKIKRLEGRGDPKSIAQIKQQIQLEDAVQKEYAGKMNSTVDAGTYNLSTDLPAGMTEKDASQIAVNLAKVGDGKNLTEKEMTAMQKGVMKNTNNLMAKYNKMGQAGYDFKTFKQNKYARTKLLANPVNAFQATLNELRSARLALGKSDQWDAAWNDGTWHNLVTASGGYMTNLLGAYGTLNRDPGGAQALIDGYNKAIMDLIRTGKAKSIGVYTNSFTGKAN